MLQQVHISSDYAGSMTSNREKITDATHNFENKGIYKVPNSNAIFIDPVRVLNVSYNKVSVSPSAYYARPLQNPIVMSQLQNVYMKAEATTRQRKRKRSCYSLNEKEILAEQRHKEARPFIFAAFEAFSKDPHCSDFLKSMIISYKLNGRQQEGINDDENKVCFVEFGKVFQAPLYEVLINQSVDEGEESGNGRMASVPLYNNLVKNEGNEEAIAECLGNCYRLPRKSSFLMSDISQINLLIPDLSSEQYNIILVDPPWENKSVNRRLLYPTLPNRYLLSIPINRLAHPEGALVALWVTNREKLRSFVEDELFPKWGVKPTASFYWLKVTKDGHMLSELDSPHHKPYECLLLGYTFNKGNDEDAKLTLKLPTDKQVLISIPGDHSRKPPIGSGWTFKAFTFQTYILASLYIGKDLLLEYAPGPKPTRALELFARELFPGWTSWGNEPLHFQHSKYFLEKMHS